jgi:hypothetical protein
MEQKGRDYSKGLIYKLQHNTINDLVYIGSTINFTRRKHCHKSSCNNENDNTLKYTTMRANGGWDSFRMVVVKLYPCNSKRELDVEEERYRVELQASLNSNRCHITDEEIVKYQKKYQKNHYEANREAILENQKKYNEANKDKLNEKFKCDCGGKFTLQNKAIHEKTKKHKQFLQQ